MFCPPPVQPVQAIQAATDAINKLPYAFADGGSCTETECGSLGSMTVTLQVEVRLRWNQFDREWDVAK
jgi:hypothetical protein